jgi:RNA-directed DNA polymerase
MLTNLEILHLAKDLKLDGNVDPIRRVYHLKLKRDLNVLTIKDRSKQMLIKLALEPEWEAKFDSNLYGFRPGYSYADAKWMITRQIQGAPKYFLECNLMDCFKTISHEHLLLKLNTVKMFKSQIRNWLKLDVFDYDFFDVDQLVEKRLEIFKYDSLSSLFVNIILNGMEKLLKDKYKRNVCLVRFATHFVVFSKNKEIVEQSKHLLEEFLEPTGLKFSKGKTRIGHTLHGQTPGLDFLGFNFRNLKVSIHNGVKNTKGVKQDFKQITKPSRVSVNSHKKEIIALLKAHTNSSLELLIESLSSKISS